MRSAPAHAADQGPEHRGRRNQQAGAGDPRDFVQRELPRPPPRGEELQRTADPHPEGRQRQPGCAARRSTERRDPRRSGQGRGGAAARGLHLRAAASSIRREPRAVRRRRFRPARARCRGSGPGARRVLPSAFRESLRAPPPVHAAGAPCPRDGDAGSASRSLRERRSERGAWRGRRSRRTGVRSRPICGPAAPGRRSSLERRRLGGAASAGRGRAARTSPGPAPRRRPGTPATPPSRPERRRCALRRDRDRRWPRCTPDAARRATKAASASARDHDDRSPARCCAAWVRDCRTARRASAAGTRARSSESPGRSESSQHREKTSGVQSAKALSPDSNGANAEPR